MTMSAHVDSFCADNLPPRDQWPVLLPLDYPSGLNCSVELLDRTIDRLGGDRSAVVSDDARWTYRELHDYVQRISRVLVEWGVQPGNRVLLRSPNNAWLMASWLAVLRVGGVVVTTMPLLRHGELEKVVDIAQVQFALVDHRFLDE